jgi:predicted nucleic acid-binding protein
MSTSKKILHLKVVLDTNVIFNGSSSDLLTKEIMELIEKYSNPADIKISWHLPEIVINERRFQMRKRGAELLPSLEKLERLLGHNLGITKEIIDARIDEAISKNVTKYQLETENLVIEKVEWGEIINCASFRLPPFEDSSKEKGFRDSLILETVMQLIAKSPSSASICRVILITNDNLLTEAFNLRTVGKTNVRVLSSIDDLESLINILDSQIKEQLINSISKQADELFFIQGNKDTLYYKENISETLSVKFANEITAIPANADKRENGQWWVSKPGFVKKEKQKIFWKTTITIDSKAINIKYSYNPSFQNLGTGLLGSISGITGSSGISGIKDFGSGGVYGLPQRPSGSISTIRVEPETIQSSEEVISTGKSKFEIIWFVTLTTKKILKTPKIESINFIETIWT